MESSTVPSKSSEPAPKFMDVENTRVEVPITATSKEEKDRKSPSPEQPSSTINDDSMEEASDDSDEDEDDSSFEEDYSDSELSDDECECPGCGRTKDTLAATVKHIEAFIETTKDKHFIDIKLTPLKGRENYPEWISGMEIALRMHQVWPIVDPDTVFAPLGPEHELFVWSERMLDVAIAVIYANVSDEVRRDWCFMHAITHRSASVMMENLWNHYGRKDSDDEDGHSH